MSNELFKVVDVSHWNGTPNYSLVKQAGIKGVMIKAGGSDAGYYRDSQFVRNYHAAKAAGLYVGAYYFAGSNFTTSTEGGRCAKQFYNMVANKQWELPVVIDIEATPTSAKAGATKAAIEFCEFMENKGFYVAIYSSDIAGFKDRLDINQLKAYDKWVARWGSEPTYVRDYGMWQYTSTGKIPGIETNVDISNVYYNYPVVMKKHGLNGY